MRKIFLDTNFIIDYLIREDFSGDAEQLLKLGKSHLKFYNCKEYTGSNHTEYLIESH